MRMSPGDNEMIDHGGAVVEEMVNMLKVQKMCVLATVADNIPHCSLMAYVTDERCRKVYMVTHKKTKKYANLLANPSVCLLVDTRLSHESSDRKHVQALTVNGTFELVVKEETASLRRRFITAHPHLQEFAEDDDAQFFAVKLQALQLLRNATDATYENLEES